MKGRRFVYLVAIGAALAAVLLLPGRASAANVTCGATLDASITLTGNMYCASYSTGPAVTITKSGVTFNLGGFTIYGNSSQDGVVADGTCTDTTNSDCNNVTVTNGAISGGNDQVDFWGTNDVASNLTLVNATDIGVYLDYTTGASVTNNTITGAANEGIYSEYGASNYIASNMLQDNGSENIYLYVDQADTVVGNKAAFTGTNTGTNYYDEYSDLNTWYGNVAQGGNYGFHVDPDGGGIVNLTNNGVAGSGKNGHSNYYIYYDYPVYPGLGASAMITGNISTGSHGDGFSDYYSVGSTWQNNTANYNTGNGFYFDYPAQETITNNTSKGNGGDGFNLNDTYPDAEGYEALSFANNSALYNAGFGFDVVSYTQAGSGNTGTGNALGDCYELSGCS